MDYWPRLKLTIHDDTAAFFSAINDTPTWFFDSTGEADFMGHASQRSDV